MSGTVGACLAGRRQRQQPAAPAHPRNQDLLCACGMQLRMLPISAQDLPLWGLHGMLGRPLTLPTSQAGRRPSMESWGRCQLREALPALSNLPAPPQLPAPAQLASAATHHKQKAFDNE